MPPRGRAIAAMVTCVLAGALLAGERAFCGASEGGQTPAGWSVRRDETTGRVRFATRRPSAGAARAIDSSEAAARAVLVEWAQALGLAPDLADLAVRYEREGLARRVVAFQQHIDGIPVLGGEVIVTFVGAEPAMLANGYEPVVSEGKSRVAGSAAAGEPRLAAADAIARLRAEIARTSGKAPVEATSASGYFTPRASDCWFPASDGTLRRAFDVYLPLAEPRGDWRGVVDALSGEVLLVVDDARHAAAVPDTAMGQVFNPNPVVTLQDTTLVDMNDQHYIALNSAYLTVELLDVEFYDGDFHLEGPHVRIAEIAIPTVPPPTSSTGQFYFPRNDDAFEAVMAYYHVDHAQRYIQSLGFTDVANYPIEVDAHGFGDADNSVFSPDPSDNGTGTIRFGDGCVDDAEDADVIYHEYGHAIQENQVPGFARNSTSARSLGEGFGDYWSASLATRAGGGYADSAQVFDWDRGPADGCWLGRRVDEFRTMSSYVNSMGAIYDNGKIWSGALWQIRSQVGADVADRLVLESNFGLPTNATYDDAAQSYRLADEALFGGDHVEVIANAFEERDIILDVSAPDLTLGVFQDPVLTAYLDIVVVSSEALDTDAVSGAVNATPVSFQQQDGVGRLFRGEHHLTSTGSITVTFSGSDLQGNETDISRNFNAAKTAGGAATVVTSPDGRFTARVPAGALPDATWLLVGAAEDTDGTAKTGEGSGGGAYVIGPVGARPREAIEVTVAATPDGALDDSHLVLAETGEPLEAWLDPQSGALVARLATLGTVTIRPGAAPARLDRTFLALSHPSPNPTAGATRFAFEVRAPQRVSLAVYSVAGQRVRTLVAGQVPPGSLDVAWDGRGDDGRLVGSGVYILRLEGERGEAARKITVMR